MFISGSKLISFASSRQTVQIAPNDSVRHCVGVERRMLDPMSAAEGSPLVPRRSPEARRRSPKVPHRFAKISQGPESFLEGTQMSPNGARQFSKIPEGSPKVREGPRRSPTVSKVP